VTVGADDVRVAVQPEGPMGTATLGAGRTLAGTLRDGERERNKEREERTSHEHVDSDPEESREDGHGTNRDPKEGETVGAEVASPAVDRPTTSGSVEGAGVGARGGCRSTLDE